MRYCLKNFLSRLALGGAPPAGGGGESPTGGIRASGSGKTLFEGKRLAPERTSVFRPDFCPQKQGYERVTGGKMQCRSADFVQNVDKKRHACYNKKA